MVANNNEYAYNDIHTVNKWFKIAIIIAKIFANFDVKSNWSDVYSQKIILHFLQNDINPE